MEGWREAIEKDPVGTASDIADAGSLATKPAVWTARGTALTQRLVGASKSAEKTTKFANNLSNFSNTLNGVSDMAIGDLYDKILNKTLGKLSQGGKGQNLLGDYIALTQRPLATIWN